MKYLRQLFIILVVTFLGETAHLILPLPIPASIYGVIILLTALCLKIISLESVRDTAHFLVEIMPIMFLPTVASLIWSWNDLRAFLFPFLITATVTTWVVMIVSGRVTQRFIRLKEGREDHG